MGEDHSPTTQASNLLSWVNFGKKLKNLVLLKTACRILWTRWMERAKVEVGVAMERLPLPHMVVAVWVERLTCEIVVWMVAAAMRTSTAIPVTTTLATLQKCATGLRIFGEPSQWRAEKYVYVYVCAKEPTNKQPHHHHHHHQRREERVFIMHYRRIS